jgi:predicted ATPase
MLAGTYAALGKFDDARRCVAEAMNTMETTKEKWFEAEVNRIAGEVALMSSEPDAAKAEDYFDRALAIALKQQANSWELRAAMRTPAGYGWLVLVCAKLTNCDEKPQGLRGLTDRIQ